MLKKIALLGFGCALLVALATGCCTQQARSSTTSTTPLTQTPAPVPQPVATAYYPAGLVKTMPEKAAVGEDIMYTIVVTAYDDIEGVFVTDVIPQGAKLIRTDPTSAVQQNKIIWNVGEMDKGTTATLKAWIRAEAVGKLGSCATIVAVPRSCAYTDIGKAVIAITKTGPTTAILGEEFAYTVVVKNTGSSVAKNVVVTDKIPDGLTHASGRDTMTVEMGDLEPSQAKQFDVRVKAAKRGKFVNQATATASNTETVSDDAPTTVLIRGLNLTKTTDDKELLINRVATYDITVANTGDTPLTGVVVTDTVAAETSIQSAPGASISGKTATWNLGTLNSGEKKNLSLKVISEVPGRFVDTASVTCQENLQQSSQADTLWVGVTGVLVEVVDDPDPIQVGEMTTFTIRVTNQGSTSAIRNLAVKALFPEETTPASASSGGSISGKNVVWPVLATLPAKQSVTYTIQARGVKAGDSRLKVEVTTENRSTPIVELESTTVY